MDKDHGKGGGDSKGVQQIQRGSGKLKHSKGNVSKGMLSKNLKGPMSRPGQAVQKKKSLVLVLKLL